MTYVKPNPALNSNVKRKKRRKFKKSFLITMGIFVVLIIALLVFLLFPTTSRKLKKLGYSPEAIELIKQDKISDILLNGQYYSDNLQNVILSGEYDLKYLNLYMIQSATSDDDMLLYDKLLAKGYTEDELLLLYSSLSFKEMTPMLVFDRIDTVDFYINDVSDHRITNNAQGYFELSGSYIEYYKETEVSVNVDRYAMIVNKHYYIDENFIPSDLITLSTQYAASDRQLQSEASDALKAVCDALQEETGLRMYASSAYRSYQQQEEIYNGYLATKGQEATDAMAARPGFSEHQTGLTVDMTPVGSSMTEFGDSEQYEWMIENCYKYGWILRYPEGKASITGYDYEPWHYRYLGVELATKVYNSGLTYDEYYELYMK